MRIAVLCQVLVLGILTVDLAPSLRLAHTSTSTQARSAERRQVPNSCRASVLAKRHETTSYAEKLLAVMPDSSKGVLLLDTSVGGRKHPN